MILYILTIVFILLASAGGTIIISKGDIFKPMRDWIERMSHKNHKWVHDVSIPDNETISAIIIDGKTNAVNIPANDYDRIAQTIYELPAFKEEFEKQVPFVKVFRDGWQTRINIDLKAKHVILFTVKNITAEQNLELGTYANSDRIAWIEFVSDLWSCPQCAGVWVGAIFYCISYLFGYIHNFNIFLMLCFGCTCSLISYLYFKAYSFMDKYING